MRRAERHIAKTNGKRHYFTGKPCKNSHVALRTVSNGSCVICVKQRLIDSRINNPEVHRMWAQRQRQKDAHKIRTRAKLYYYANKDKCKANNKMFFAKNIGIKKIYRNNRTSLIIIENQNYRARRLNADGHFCETDIQKLFQIQKGRCAYCPRILKGKRIKSIDHKIPLSRGGSNWPNNLQLVCFSCNAKKGSRTHDEFVAYLEKTSNMKLAA